MMTSLSAMASALLGACLVLLCTGQQSAPAVDPRLVCKTDIDCTEGFETFPEFRCVNGRCTAGYDAPTYSCTRFCPQYHTCVKGRCVIGTAGQPCPNGQSAFPFGSKECLFGFICDPVTKKCIPGTEGSSCIDQIECQKGLICDRGEAKIVGSGKTSAIGFEKSRGICKKSFVGAKLCFADRECGHLLCQKTTGFTGTCMKRPDYANSAWPQGFGKCFDVADCPRGGFVCDNGNCQPRRLETSCSRNCGQFMVCKNKKCIYGTEGTACDVTRFGSACLPGLYCKVIPGAVEDLQGRTPGTCTKGVLGTPCTQGSECEKGLLCGSSGTCVATVEGQKCLSSFWCPEKAKCEKISKTCTFNTEGRPASDFMPETVRPSSCATTIECPETRAQDPCINGLCLPFRLGKNCTNFVCGTGSDCVNGLCTERLGGDPCTSREQCFTGFECKLCLTDKPCGPNVCQATVSGSNCTLSRNCGTGTSCANLVRLNGGYEIRTCATGTPGVRCRTDRNCQKGLKCLQRRCSFPLNPAPAPQ